MKALQHLLLSFAALAAAVDTTIQPHCNSGGLSRQNEDVAVGAILAACQQNWAKDCDIKKENHNMRCYSKTSNPPGDVQEGCAEFNNAGKGDQTKMYWHLAVHYIPDSGSDANDKNIRLPMASCIAGLSQLVLNCDKGGDVSITDFDGLRWMFTADPQAGDCPDSYKYKITPLDLGKIFLLICFVFEIRLLVGLLSL
ncbi:uncharacterized protein BDZ99DRAFT_168610 [Mytilinidion resinicola]|uniref:Uncharacterized protein n=1 Tax=Mytilinidion resinicola TaxID=574789 RepID=A0A6A6Y4C6_9PEZI|nr:uncharacterized protein BDZ99DRAFT_168610 [Mytilinidion resinicola]KAF2803656.1 hypothetical protein BDZ99DRAFT_168610 [Mytilinidion resinicola]